MAPQRKDPEKQAWIWAESCDPLAMNDHDVRIAYRLNFHRCKFGSCRKNCKGNPYCLNNLGELRWLGNPDECFGSHQSDPETERREDGTYVGLKNLGATCYANSLLQLWFHNINFRKAILKWNPFEDPNEKFNPTLVEDKYVPSTFLGHLQAIFALMEYGNRRFIDPSDFISSLRLDTTVQQDAQEFSKLFLCKLEIELSYQSLPEVQNLIKDNFSGEYSYITRCMKCQNESKCRSTFYELDLQIKGHKTIEDCLQSFTKTELLDEDDKYFCQICGSKQDAQRFIVVNSLPPVLNLQLMRFMYDKNTGNKKKINSFIQFPEKLNMAEYCNLEGNLEYNLSAVLVHGGRSANSGHYVAHICDSETGTWYKFNDETVEKIEGKKLKLGTEDDDDVEGNKKKVNKVPKGSHHSLSAYMLVYTRVKEPNASDTDTQENHEMFLPSHLYNLVANENSRFEDWIKEVSMTNSAKVGRCKKQQVEMASLITMLPIESDCEEFDAVPTMWLMDWLSDVEQENRIENKEYICMHGKLNPSKLVDLKYISSEVAEKLYERYGGGPRLRSFKFKCKKCVFFKCCEIRVKCKINEELKCIQQRMKLKTINESETYYWVGKQSYRNWRQLAVKALHEDLLADSTELLEHIFGKERDSCTRSGGMHLYEQDVNRLRECFSIVQQPSVDTRRIYELIRLVLREKEPVSESHEAKMEPEVDTEEESGYQTEEMMNGEAKSEELTNGNGNVKIDVLTNGEVKTENDVNVAKNTDQQPVDNGVVPDTDNKVIVNGDVKKAQIKAQISNMIDEDEYAAKARSTVRSITRVDEGDDESSIEDNDFNEDLLCPHDKLCVEDVQRRLVPESVWGIFKKYFPKAGEFPADTQPCNTCKSIASEDEVAKDMYKNNAHSQKEQLIDLYLDRNRPQLKPDGAVHYLVNKEFINSWRKFIREAGKKEPPHTIKNRCSLICQEHSLLQYDLNIGIPNAFAVVSEDEWLCLSKLYHPDYSVQVWCEAEGKFLTNPEPCPTCVQIRVEEERKARLFYTRAKIYLKLQNEEDIESFHGDEGWPPAKRLKSSSSVVVNGNTSVEYCNNNNISSNANVESHNLNGANNNVADKMLVSALNGIVPETAVRRSTRSRRIRGVKELFVSSDMTLLDVKKKVCAMMGVAPMDQHLTTDDGRSIDDSQVKATLADLRIYPEMTLFLKVDEPCDGISPDDFITSREPEEGFKGTGLLS